MRLGVSRTAQIEDRSTGRALHLGIVQHGAVGGLVGFAGFAVPFQIDRSAGIGGVVAGRDGFCAVRRFGDKFSVPEFIIINLARFLVGWLPTSVDA